MSDQYAYAGDELDVFRLAVNWKHYWARKIDPFLGDRVLEVGAGIGGTTQQLVHQERRSWVGIEPDQDMFAELQHQAALGTYPDWCEFRLGTVADLPATDLFDSIIYIDVLEHIEKDQEELALAAQHLETGGFIVVLAPAYQFLFSEFDASIGHYRRYTRKTLQALGPPGTKLVKSFYLDSVGLMTSLVNKFFLHSPNPTAEQITFWDRYIIPFSTLIDALHFYSFGRSIVAVWQRL